MNFKSLVLLGTFALTACGVQQSESNLTEVKKKGTYVPFLCGDTKSFPASTSVCLAKRVGFDGIYMGVESYNPMKPTTINLPSSYFKVTLKKAADHSVVYTGVSKKGGSKLTWTLIVKDAENGKLLVNGKTLVGGDSIIMQPIMTTMNVQ